MRSLDDMPLYLPPCPGLPCPELPAPFPRFNVNIQQEPYFARMARLKEQVKAAAALDSRPCEDKDPSYVITHSGQKVFLEYPSAEAICLGDIVHALSQSVRCTGHGGRRFTLAQHSVVASYFAAADGRMSTARWALFHDGHEAYLGDVSAPLKRLIGPAYEELAARFDRAIAAKFGLEICSVKQADLQAMVWELNVNGPRCSLTDWFGAETVEKYDLDDPLTSILPGVGLDVWDTAFAESMFFGRCRELGVV